jgi:hypothetical protein
MGTSFLRSDRLALYAKTNHARAEKRQQQPHLRRDEMAPPTSLSAHGRDQRTRAGARIGGIGQGGRRLRHREAAGHPSSLP